MAVGKLRKGLKLLHILSKSAHKPYLVIVCELFYWRFVLGESILFYFDYEMFLKGKKPRDYVCQNLFSKVEKQLNTPEYYPILEDKYFFYKIVEGAGFRSPKNLYLIDPSGIFNLESMKYISEDEFLQKDIEGFFKLNNGFGGNDIYQIDLVNKNILLNKENVSLSKLLKLTGRRKYLIQERIIQHEEMNVLNSSCVNTLRMLTIRDGQNIHLFQEYLRIGINNSYVDNGLSGNIMVGIQKDEGRLLEFALSPSLDDQTHKYRSHPQTDTAFKDFNIPFHAESVEMVKSLHLLFQEFFMIGWDIGITPDGPIVIEGNNITTLFPFQALYGGLKSSFNDLAKSYSYYI